MGNQNIDENRRTQLSELNTRARAYASQLWQVPFAYLTIAGVLLLQLKDQFLHFGLFFISVFGISVLVHMFYVVSYHNKTVQKIRTLEKEMGLHEATKAKPGGTVAPFMSLVFLGVLSPGFFPFPSSLICPGLLIWVCLILFGIVAYIVCNSMANKDINENNNGGK